MTRSTACSRLGAVKLRSRTSARAILARSSSPFHFLQTLRLLFQQMRSDNEQIGERAGDEEAVRVLLQAAVTHLLEAEYALDHAEHVLDSRTHSGLRAVLRPFDLVDNALEAIAPVGEVERV